MQPPSIPDYITAIYTPQRIPRYRGNILIEALPPPLDDDNLIASLRNFPEFHPEQRAWSGVERIQQIAQLSSFLVPMPRHIALAQGLDALMRQGYVGRAPRSKAAHQIFAKLYEQQKAGKTFDLSPVELTAQLSSALIGIPGTGKTTGLRNILARYPQVIFHPNHHIYQVPSLHIEAPYDGASVKGLAASIFRKMDQLFPDADYGRMYGKTSSGAETLMNHAARVLHMHAVGVLVLDEIQNLANAPKMMTLLVSASNELGVPMFFVGTNKAEEILTRDFRQARRSSGLASSYWGQLIRGENTQGEWDLFLNVLWKFQWVRSPTPFTSEFSELMYRYTQGIPDLAIKIFAIAQARAIHDGTEILTGTLFDSVAQNELARVQPMVTALRNGDHSALAIYSDIAPIGLDGMLNTVGTTISERRSSILIASAPASTITAPPSTLTSAEQISSSTRKPAKSAQKAASMPIHDYPQGDYRNGLNTMLEGTTVLERLKSLGMVTDVEQFLIP